MASRTLPGSAAPLAAPSASGDGSRAAGARRGEPSRKSGSRTGKLWVYSIVHQSSPGVPVPYVAAIVDLPEGVSVRCSLIDVPPDPAALSFGMPVEMTTRVSQQDREGNDVVAFYFRPLREGGA